MQDGQAGPKTSLSELAKQVFLDYATDISGSVVYLDAGAAEFTHISLGAPFLLGLGALNVCDLDKASSEDGLLASLSGTHVSSLVIATTRLLTESHPFILRAVQAHPDVTRVLVLSSISEHAHALQATSELGVEAFAEYASMLLGDVQDSREGTAQSVSSGGAQGTGPLPVSVSVKQLPMHLCVLDEGAFVLPARSGPAMTSRSGGAAAGFQPADPAEADGQGGAAGVSLIAHALIDVVRQLGGALETYSLGPVSHLIAREVASLPYAPQADAGHVGLVVVDRALDLVTPGAYHPDHLLDVMLATLDRQEYKGPGGKGKRGRGRNAQVDWRPLDARIAVPGLCALNPLPVAPDTQPDQQTVYGTELLQPSDKAAAARLEQLNYKKSKDAAVLVRKWLKQSLASERLAPSQRTKAGPVTSAELLGLVDDLVTHPDASIKQRSTIALAHAVAHSLSSGTGSSGGDAPARWELISSLQRQLSGMLVQMGLQEGGSAVAAAIKDALSTAQQDQPGALLATDILSLLPSLYSLTLDASESSGGTAAPGPFNESDSASVRDALVAALVLQAQAARQTATTTGGRASEHGDGPAVVRAKAAAVGLAGLLPGWQDSSQLDQDLHECVDVLLHRLTYVAQARASLSELRHVTVSDVFADNVGATQPILRTLLRRIMQGTNPTDLQQVTPESLGGLLSKGLSRMGFGGGLLHAVAGSVAHKHPPLRECGTILVFVVGGISLAEVREVQQEAELHADTRFILAGTSLLSPLDITRQLGGSA